MGHYSDGRRCVCMYVCVCGGGSSVSSHTGGFEQHYKEAANGEKLMGGSGACSLYRIPQAKTQAGQRTYTIDKYFHLQASVVVLSIFVQQEYFRA